MKRSRLIVVLGLAACSSADPPPAPQPPPEEQKAVADPNWVDLPMPELRTPRRRNPQSTDLVYLEPDEFPEAPPELRPLLRAMGCRIPQLDYPTFAASSGPSSPHNLVAGYFKSLDQQHWAVICSRSGSSAVLLFDSAGQLVEEIKAAAPDEHWLQGIDEEGTLGYSYYLDVAAREHILEDHRSFGHGPAPPPIWHDGLEIGFAGKASTIHYWHDCQWLELAGAD